MGTIKAVMVIKIVFLCLMVLSLCLISIGSNTFLSESNIQNIEFGAEPGRLKGSIEVWTWDLKVVEVISENFREVCPDVKVITVDTSWTDYFYKLKAAVMTGINVPDIVQLEIGFLADTRNLEGIENLSDAPYNGSRFSGAFSDYYEPLCRNREGKFTSLPFSPGGSATYYRRDLAKEYLGTDDPKELERMMPTWGKVLEVGTKLKTNSKGTAYIIGNAFEIYNIMINQLNGSWIDRKGNLTFEENVRIAAEVAIKARNRGIDTGVLINSSAWLDLLKNGSTLLVPSGIWAEGYFLRENCPDDAGKWGVMETPGGNTNSGGSSFAIPSLADSKEAAWIWIEMACTDTNTQIEQFTKTSNYPALKAVLTNSIFDQPVEYFKGQKAWRKYIEMSQDISLPTINENGFLISNIVNDNIRLAIEGKIPLVQAIEESKEQIGDLVDALVER